MQILIVAALIIIGILLFELIIFSHEFGHFITAKLSGVKVNEFALGMGPKLFGFKKGETQYTLRLFPIGGFCAMEGEDEDSDEPRAFNNAKIWKRMIIIIAGAVMNIILGFIMMFAFTVQADSYVSTTVDGFYSLAHTASSGLKSGDEIIEINGYSIWNTRDLQFAIATLPCKEVDGKTLDIYRQDCEEAALSVCNSIITDNKPNEKQHEELSDIYSDGRSEIAKAQTKEEAYKALEKVCSKAYAVFGISDYKIPEIKEQDTRQRFIADVKVKRNGEEVKLNQVQFYTLEGSGDTKSTVSIDFALKPIEKTFGSVISQTFTETCSMAKTVWTSLVWLVQGRFSFNDLSGPVGIATVVTNVASQGLQSGFGDAVNNILFVMILITVNLGIVNMLPFPALDGGRFVFLLIEGIFKKPIPRKVEQVVNAAGLALLMIFMVVISVKDIWQLVTGNFPGMQ